MSPYTFSVRLPLSITAAEQGVRSELKRELFGIISEIDIQAKLREKLGVEHPPHKILGACNPKLAYQALRENTDVALALPCNVVLEERDGQTTVTALFPSAALRIFKGHKVRESEQAAETALKRVFTALTPLSRS